MKHNFFYNIAAAAFLSILVFSSPSAADRLDAIKKAGVLRVASFDSNPPFGFIDETKAVVGLDIDFARAVSDKLGVRLQILPTNPANRIPLLISGQVDLVIANFTITRERAKQVGFSIPYFSSGQQFIAKKGILRFADQLSSLRIGADKGTTNEINLKKLYPHATVITYDDTPFAFAALRSGNVQAVTQDGPKLIGLLANMSDADQYEISSFTISSDYMGIAVQKNEKTLLNLINETLLELERSGKAEKIYNKWFGLETKTPLMRLFKIGEPQ